MRISIVIPNVNSPIIQDVLASIYRQTGYDQIAEIIVVGRDEVDKIRPHPLVRLVATPKLLTPAEARNLGAELSRGEIIIFMDSDVVLFPSTIVTLGERAGEGYIIGGSVVFETTRYWQLAGNILSFSTTADAMPAESRDYLPTMLLALQHTIWEDVGPFNTDYKDAAGEDTDWALRASRQGYRLLFEPQARCYHRPSRITYSDFGVKMRQYGAAWGQIYLSFMSGQHWNPRYTARGRLEYLRLLLWAAKRCSSAGSIVMIWIDGWIESAALRDVLLLFVQQAYLRRYWYTLPALLLLQREWYRGALQILRQQSERYD